MLWIKAFHIIFVVTWFAGLFYLPRLFVYHTLSRDAISLERFQLMERRLYRGIMTPAAILATLFGLWLLSFDFKGYLTQGWMHAKLSLIAVLWLYHLYCGHLLKHFPAKSTTFYRWFNEFPVLILVSVVILVVVKPF